MEREVTLSDNSIRPEYLDAIDLNIDLIINNSKVLNEQTTFFECIKTLVELQKNNVDAGEFFQSFLDTTISIALGDFSKPMPSIETVNPLANSVIASMNMLIQELEYYTTRKCFLDGVLDFISEPAIVIKTDGKIHALNTDAEKLCGYKLEELLNVNITKLFATQKVIEMGLEATPIDRATYSIFNKSKDMVPIKFYVRPLKESRSNRQEDLGYIFIMRKRFTKRKKNIEII